jgi:TRAP transporter TAXI family solute receptor
MFARLLPLTFSLLLLALVGWEVTQTSPQAEAQAALPRTFGWTAYGTTSAGYAISVAMGNALAGEGYRLRVIPAKNDVSRMTPLRAGRVDFSAMGVGSYLAQEGVLDFADRRWGPQPVRLMLMSWSDAINGVVVTARNAEILSAADLRGKRIAWVVGGPALNQNMTGWLAFGDLGWDDVVRVEASGWKASIQGIIDGTIDAAVASTNSSMLYQLDGSPRGLRFIGGAPDDTESWARMWQQAPWFNPHVATAGVGLSEETPLVGASYGYPILVTYAAQSEQAVDELMRLLHRNFEGYRDAHSVGVGFAIERQVFDWIVPYHAGAVRYLREIGVWTEAHDAHNAALIARQAVLIEAWTAQSQAPAVDDQAFEAQWLERRAQALDAAGMDPIWRP